ncbi:NUDIX hydrolase domain-like protein [Gamsiella multidivaricata]|uniref:NUDIX hydrolase domain-like protein n=1 Tax=Gamsiella multidivaricata TaxID=101098 RepID=UPI00221EE3A8|nr:NUDIX hydrolase domain-like protein [Gamsiella multidivaricata]KAG0370291.1 hypothetical protein BGZ54_006977 [Gamsiella multidivaricata]KAI7832415.1 NUDIX hydrolase domain-like protein [Gamsiella multidivaricata]
MPSTGRIISRSRSLIRPMLQLSLRSCQRHSSVLVNRSQTIYQDISATTSTEPPWHHRHQRPTRYKAEFQKRYYSSAGATAISSQYPIQYDRAFLDHCKKRLEEKANTSAYFVFCKEDPVRQAGVFMPLCIYKGVPSVLFTIRANNMRNHRGEVSFPGGKRDPTDKNILDTALREMEEEISVSRDQIEVLGEYAPMPNKDCTMKVHPFVGFIKEPIEDIESIVFNKGEVDRVFTVPIQDLINPKKGTLVPFRNSKFQYRVWNIEQEQITIWGLTAFILDGVLRHIKKNGPVDATEIPEGAKVEGYEPPKPSA